MGTCGSIDYTSGGTIVSSTVVNSTVQGSTVSDSTINSATITNLSGIDSASAKVLLESLIASLDSTALQKLAEAIQPLLTVSTTVAPDTDRYDYLPNRIAGTADTLLGRPDIWLEIGGMKVPAYD